MKTIRFGIFGDNEIEVDDNGFIEIPVIVQESGLYGGAPPAELRITRILNLGDNEFHKQWVAKLNRHTDLPYYLTTAKVKIVGEMVEITDETNAAEGISPIES